MEFDIISSRTIYKIMEQYHFITENRHRGKEQRFRIMLYCRTKDSIKEYPYRFITEQQLIDCLIQKYKRRSLFKIAIEAIEKTS